jgi:transposase InsO family protein
MALRRTAPGPEEPCCDAGQPKNKWHDPKMGYAFVHTVIDDHSRVAYAEIHDDETASTATGVLSRAIQWLADRGVTVERVLSDNGSAYRSGTVASAESAAC